MLTAADYQLLRDLRNPGVLTLGKQRVGQLLDVVDRAVAAAHQSEMETGVANFQANALWLAASGKLTEAMIAEQPRLSAEQRADLLALVQLRYDAEAWREHTSFTLPDLPAAVQVGPEPATT